LSERLSRTERRALLRDDEPFLSMPINIGGDSRRAEAHVRHLVRLFQSDRSSSPCSDVMTHLSALAERTVPVATTGAVACRRGCSHCCYQRVTVTAPEAFFIAAHIRTDKQKVARVKDTHQCTNGMSHEERLAAHIPCPMLVDSICSIHAIRPTGCRCAVSLDVEACIAAYVNMSKNEIPMPLDHIQTINVMRVLLGAAMALMRFPMTGYELDGAVAAALADGAEKRWLAGEDVFAGVDVDTSAPQTFLSSIERMAQHVAPSV